METLLMLSASLKQPGIHTADTGQIKKGLSDILNCLVSAVERCAALMLCAALCVTLVKSCRVRRFRHEAHSGTCYRDLFLLLDF